MFRLTREQSRQVDQIAINHYRIPGIVLMENAARGAAEVAMQMLQARPDGVGTHHEVLVVCGGGNNGGDGLAIARHLHNLGIGITILLTIDPGNYRGDAETNYKIITAMELPVSRANPQSIGLQKPELVIDAIFGTGLFQPPRDPFPSLVRAIHELQRPILAVDIPSGLDCDTGKPLGPVCIAASRTVTFGTEKTAFAAAEAKRYVGQITVADIGCPREVFEQISKA